MEYSRLVESYEFLEKTGARLKKVEEIVSLLEEVPGELLREVTLLLQGAVFPAWSDNQLGIAQQLMVKAIAQVVGFQEKDIVKQFKKTGDLGLVIENLVSKKKQTTLLKRRLNVEKVFENLQKVASVEGKGSVERKLSLVTELMSFASPKEAKYIARTTLGTLRIGVAEGVIRDSIAKAFFSDALWDEKKILEVVRSVKGKRILAEKGVLGGIAKKKKAEKEVAAFRKYNKVKEVDLKEIEKVNTWKVESKADYILLGNEKLGNRIKKRAVDTVEMAWFLRPDYGEIAKIAKEKGLKGLERVGLKVGNPYQVLLSEKAPTLEDAIKTYDNPALEFKYDGARLSAHKSGNKVWLFTRRLENVTNQFPEVVELVKKGLKAREAIVEGEMVGFHKGRPMPFQFLSQRIKRKYDIEKVAGKIPVQVNLFDVVFLEGKSLFSKPLKERWKTLKKIVKPLPGKWELAKHLETKDLKKAEAFYKDALKASQEGLIVKNLDAFYQPGRRVGFWLKVKPTLENLDLVIIGAVWGEGKRTGWLGSYVLGCRDPSTGKFLECGMIGTGIKEKEESGGVTFKELTKLLKPLIEKEKSNKVTVRPKVVVEVAYEEIQKSPNYASGYALRFPRVKNLRTSDKTASQADTLERVEYLYKLQKGRK